VDTTSTVEKAVDILFHLHRSAEPQGVTAIGRSLGLPKSSAHRLLAALGRKGLVERTDTGHYRTGAALIELGLGVLEREPVVEAARPVLARAALEFGETFFLVAPRARELVVLEKVEGRGFLRASPQVGARVPAHATAVGKLYLAFAADQIDSAADLQAFTTRTLIEPSRLEAELAQVRERGWAENRDEWVMGLGVVAAPIRFRGGVVGAIAIAAASPRLEEMGDDRVSAAVMNAARAIEARLTPMGGRALEGDHENGNDAKGSV